MKFLRTFQLAACAALVLGAARSANANVVNFSYSGISGAHFATVLGSGVITTDGIDHGGGYQWITAITGTTEYGAITGLEPGNSTPPAFLGCCGGTYVIDNAFNANNLSNPFSGTGGLLFNTGTTQVNLFGDALSSGNTYEFSYAEDSFVNTAPMYGGTQVSFTASVATPDGGTTLMLLGGAFAGLAALRRKLRA